jgi:hypothetical protein
MREANIFNYQEDFDNSVMVDFPDEIIAANPSINEGDQILEILLTHPMPYKVVFTLDSNFHSQQYFLTLEEAELAKNEWLNEN